MYQSTHYEVQYGILGICNLALCNHIKNKRYRQIRYGDIDEEGEKETGTIVIVFTSLHIQLFIYRPYYIFILQCILILFNNSNQWYCKSSQTPFSSSITYRSLHQQKTNVPSCRLNDPGLHDCKDKIDNSHRSNTHLRNLLD